MADLTTNAALNLIAQTLLNVNPDFNNNAALNLIAETIQGVGATLNNWVGEVDPTSADWDGYTNGSFWYNQSNNQLFVAISVLPLAEEATWLRIDTPAPAYGIYTAWISQTGTNAPTAVILQNTLSSTPTWSYVSPGVYKLTGASLAYNIAAPYMFDINGVSVRVAKTGADELTITALGNGLLSNALIDLKIYNI